EKVEEFLKRKSIKITTKEELANVATISANNDTAIGNLISGIMERVGAEGTINVQDGKTLDHEIEYVEGIKFDRGYISPYFVTNPKTQKCEYDNPLLLLLDNKVSDVNHLVRYLEFALSHKRPLIIIAEDVESEVLAALIINKLRGNLKIAAVKSPGFGDNRKNLLYDMAIATGAELISEDIGKNLENSNPQGIFFIILRSLWTMQ
ncbi:MAG: chaperonin GroEL, partial [Flammeovirgaceae bacterium]